MIELSSVRKRFANSETDAVTDLTLSIEEGEIVVLVGPSGCGKTTTLRMINRLVEPTAGSIVVAGRPVGALPVHELRRTIGYVIQQIGLFPHRSIAHNIGTVPSLLGWDKAAIATRVDELAELVDIDRSILDRYPSELSGGQRQRVGVARALAANPPVLLMDEPFGAVDPIVRERLQRELLDLQRRVTKTIVLVTHDIDEAIRVGDRVAILNTGGILEQYATPAELLAHPANDFVAGFLGADRGIKRLSLMPLDDDILEVGPVIGPSAGVAEAMSAMERCGVDWVLVVEDGSIRGRVHRASLTNPSVADAPLEPFLATIEATATLKDALEAIVSNNGRYAAVVRGGRFVGMVSTDAISMRIIT